MLNLHCIPFAGASGSIYQNWSSWLPKDINLKIYHPPGKGLRFNTPLPSSWSELVDDFCCQFSLDGNDNILFGHSLGAAIAYEAALKLSAIAGSNIKLLIVSGRRAPFLPSMTPHISSLPDAIFIERLKSYQGTPAEVLELPEFKEIFLPAIRNDFRLSETHYSTVHRKVDIPIVAFCGSGDEYAPRETVLSWAKMTNKAFESVEFPGGHFFVSTVPSLVANEIALKANALKNLNL